ncbi:MAG: hypothetical protein HY556_04865 [Euryarchaeota archaeon]|nr:hypothetical protein [Euryarchaeota archaeon]
MAEFRDCYREVVESLAAWRKGKKLPDRDLIMDAYIQQEFRRRKLQVRRAALMRKTEGAGPEMDAWQRNLEIVNRELTDVEAKVSWLHSVRSTPDEIDALVVEKAKSALKQLKIKGQLSRNELGDTGV